MTQRIGAEDRSESLTIMSIERGQTNPSVLLAIKSLPPFDAHRERVSDGGSAGTGVSFLSITSIPTPSSRGRGVLFN